MPSFPLENPGIIAASGPDAIRFLNGQLTQDARSLASSTRFCCITDAKGKLEHFVEIISGQSESSIWIVCRKEETERVLARLERYLIADEVTLTDLSGRWHRSRRSDEVSSSSFSRSSSWPSGWIDSWFQDHPGEQPVDALTDHEIEELRISLGIPRWGCELQPGMLPPEAGLDSSAISYNKGCYIGQETLSRIKSAGKLNRRLTQLTMDGQAAIGDTLELDGIPCGEITSVAPSGSTALGYVKKAGFEAAAFNVSGRSTRATVIKKKA